MKNIFLSAVVVCFSTLAMAQVLITPDLTVAGKFGKSKSVTVAGIKSKKSCALHGGRMFKGKCKVTAESSSVEITAFDEGYMLQVESINAEGKVCSYKGIAQKKNMVQLISKSEDSACEVEVHFENGNELAVRTNGMCNEGNCGVNTSLNLDGLKRVQYRK